MWQVFAYYSIDRFVVDQFRYYEPQEILGTLGLLTINTNHILLGGLIILSMFFWFKGWSKQRQKRTVD